MKLQKKVRILSIFQFHFGDVIKNRVVGDLKGGINLNVLDKNGLATLLKALIGIFILFLITIHWEVLVVGQLIGQTLLNNQNFKGQIIDHMKKVSKYFVLDLMERLRI